MTRDDLLALALDAYALGDTGLTGPKALLRLGKIVDQHLAKRPKAEPLELPPAVVDGAWAERLTPRERETVALLVRGESTRELAARLHLTISTVNTYLKRIFAKLEVHSRVELLAVVRGDRALPGPEPRPPSGRPRAAEVAEPRAKARPRRRSSEPAGLSEAAQAVLRAAGLELRPEALDGFTRAQRDVLACLVAGKDRHEGAHALGMPLGVFGTRAYHARRKLGLDRDADLRGVSGLVGAASN